MRPIIKTLLLTLLTAMAVTLFTAPNVLAAPTQAGTTISNQATLTFLVGGSLQPTVTNDTPTTFTVDRKIDLVVVNNDTTTVSAYPSSNTSYLTFVVTNTGNDTQDFHLFAEQANDLAGIDIDNNGAGGGDVTDTFDLTSYAIFVESGDAPGYDVLDVATYIDDLTYDDGGGTDNQQIVYVVGTMPADNGGTGFVASDIAGVTLFAQVMETTHDGNADITLNDLVSCAIDLITIDQDLQCCTAG